MVNFLEIAWPLALCIRQITLYCSGLVRWVISKTTQETGGGWKEEEEVSLISMPLCVYWTWTDSDPVVNLISRPHPCILYSCVVKHTPVISVYSLLSIIVCVWLLRYALNKAHMRRTSQLGDHLYTQLGSNHTEVGFESGNGTRYYRLSV